MRYQLAKSLEKLAEIDKKIVFLTGDLGYQTFEKLQEKLGDRFINAGVAEHNMVTMAAGLAYAGFKPWIYSVAPFVTIKVLEEIRNDVTFNNHNVKIVGLGGGYDYAIAGPTHHVLQDVSMMLSLQHMKVYIPGFIEDLDVIVKKMNRESGPGYLRLTKAEKVNVQITPYSPVRRIIKGGKLTVIILGSMINRVIPALSEIKNKNSANVWLVSEMPFKPPEEFVTSIKKTKNILVIEEHVKLGGLGSYVNDFLRQENIKVKNYSHLYAKGYFSKRYGSRDFYLKESGLDKNSIRNSIQSFL